MEELTGCLLLMCDLLHGPWEAYRMVLPKKRFWPVGQGTNLTDYTKWLDSRALQRIDR